MAKIISQYRDEAKKRIIQAGFEVLLEKGYCHTTMEEIAHKLEVTKPALYRYFTSKDELIIESAKDGQERYQEVIDEQGKNRCPIHSWLEIFDQVMNQNPGYQSLYLDIVAMSYRKKELQEFSYTRMKEEIERITKKFSHLQDDDLIRRDIEPHHLALTLIALFNGMRLQFLLGVDQNQLRDTWLKNLQDFLFTKEHRSKNSCYSCPWNDDCTRVIE
nr:TetR/AcrR family transcriptional regulator [uncultured Methanospirillum sp.]